MFSRKKFKDIKSLINLSIVRVNNVRKKANQELGVKKRLLAKHLQDGEYALARLEAERIVKLDWKVEAMNIIEIKCEEIRDNVPLLQQQKTVPADLEEAIACVIYAQPRAGVAELKEVIKLLERKYGQEFTEMQRNNGSKRVEDRLIHRLSGKRPNAYLVYSYMKEIAKNFGIEFIDDEVTRRLGERFDVPMTAGSAGTSSASGIGSSAYEVTDGSILPPGKKPPGFVPPSFEEADFAPQNTGTGDQSNLPAMGDDGDDEDDEGSSPPKPQVKPKPKPQVKKAAPKPKPKPKAKIVPKKKDDGLSSLQDRFNKLQDL